ncbi:MAG: TIR domain-containing protein [Geminicoccaceae bacterium]
MTMQSAQTNAYYVNIFISHSWSYSEHYEKLSEWIFDGNWRSNNRPIKFNDLSIPQDDPIHDAANQDELQAAIFNEIAKCHVVVIPTGMYTTHSKWIQKEIEGSNEYGKPILGVNPWGQERASSVVRKNARQTVGWTGDSVINGIWSLYSGS